MNPGDPVSRPGYGAPRPDLPQTVVYRSRRKRDCDERLLVLTAVGIAGAVVLGEGEFLLLVAGEDAGYAATELLQYDSENRPLPPPPPPAPLFPGAWLGAGVYVAVLLGVTWMLSSGAVRLDAFDLGELDAARIQGGQWWRAWTALTLHLDGPHLAANIGAGVWFGYLAARQLGAGTAWLLTVTAAAIANLLEGLLGPPEHRSVGASTAVFAALGALSAYSWRERLRWPQRWVRRWAPLVAGVILLGWTGTGGGESVLLPGDTGGAQVDVMAHLAGFAVGALLGATVALPRVRPWLTRVPQWLAGAVALASLAIAWACALRA
ncbi:MAG: rhomboid family intramembrane serine protease [Proteobacteria bacterium]|nr:rhomboid family intramembrane serine protease [Pseudomonadota bacterium]